MSILIISFPGDIHALAVQWGLEELGERAQILCWSDVPQKVCVSFQTDGSSSPKLLFGGDAADILPADLHSVWNRRKAKAVAPPEIRKADVPAIDLNSDLFYSGVMGELERTTFMANSNTSKVFIDNKVTQLALAVECGFRVPATTVSNDPGEIAAFQRRWGPCIVKPFRFMGWKDTNKDITLRTTILPDVTTMNPLSIRACPMIYQARIEKRHEYRVVVFGNEIFTYRLDSQDNEVSALDFREIGYKTLPIRVDRLPEAAEAKIRKFMKASGAVCGSFDFAITPAGELVFFEFNEQGQFIWLEERDDEFPLLDIFCQFLSSGQADFTYRPTATPLRYRDYEPGAERAVQIDRESRVHYNMDKRLPDRVA